MSAIQYRPFGPVQHWSWGNGTTHNRDYNTDGDLTGITSGGQTQYLYDDARRITQQNEVNPPGISHTYSYDLLDRLTTATGTGLNQSWSYDANGNRLTETGSTPATYTQALDSNRLTHINGSLTRTYTYDTAGNILGDGHTLYTYNDAGRLSSATRYGQTTQYDYNALGQRVRKSNNNGVRYFLYDDAGQLAGEYDANGQLIQETVWLGNIPVATLRPAGSGVAVYYIHTDHLNTPRRISRASDNQIVWRWDNDPFGRHTANEDPDGDSQLFTFSLRYPGQYYDEETGLHYNYFRDYDPVTGRYIQSDLIGLNGGLNTYAYVNGNPTVYVDPLGLETNVFMHAGAGWGGSSMGHVATDINGTTYTYGPDGMTVLPTDQYLERNDFRDTKALKLNLTFDQEEQLENRLAWQQGKGSYGALGHNCGDPLESGLEQLGFDMGVSVTPQGLYDALKEEGLIGDELCHSTITI